MEPATNIEDTEDRVFFYLGRITLLRKSACCYPVNTYIVFLFSESFGNLSL